MDRFGIGKIGLTGFGVGEFRLPVFGDGSGHGSGGQGSTFHESLVDVWFMSGYNNADAPALIRGVKGNELQLKNFAFTSESGFGEGNYEGALVFDGVDDYGICSNLPILTDYTVICRRSIITVKNASATASKRSYPDDVGNFGAFVFERTFAAGNKSIYSFGAANGIDAFDENETVYQTKTSYNGKAINSGSNNDSEYLCLGANAYNINTNRCQEFSNIAVYYFALYDKSLTPEEIEEEKVKLEQKWNSKLNKS